MIEEPSKGPFSNIFFLILLKKIILNRNLRKVSPLFFIVIITKNGSRAASNDRVAPDPITLPIMVGNKIPNIFYFQNDII